MGRSLNQIMKALPADRREKIEARAAELHAVVMTLAELRKALSFTQERIAKELDIGQDGVSRIEKRSDLLLSTLRSFVQAMGGELQLLARFGDRPPVIIDELATIADREDRKRRAKVVAG